MRTEIKFDDVFDKEFEHPFGLEEISLSERNIFLLQYSKIKCIECNNFTCYASNSNADWDYDFVNYKCRKCSLIYGVCLNCNELIRGCHSCDPLTGICSECPDVTKGPFDITTVELSLLLEHHNYDDYVKEDGDNYEIVSNVKSINTSQNGDDNSYQDDNICGDDSSSDDSISYKYHYYFDKTFIRYKTPVYYFNEDIFGTLTGKDGGNFSVWKCNCCEKMLITDK